MPARKLGGVPLSYILKIQFFQPLSQGRLSVIVTFSIYARMFQYGPSLHYVCDTLCCSYNLSKPPTHDPETFSAAIKGTKTLILLNSFNFQFVTADWNDL